MPASSAATHTVEKRNSKGRFRPLKQQCPGSVKAAVSRLFDQVGGIARVMLVLRLGKSQVYAFADEQSPHELHLSQAAALTTASAPALAEYFAALAEGVFLPLGSDAGASALHALTAEAARESGEAVANMLEALRDGRLDKSEARHAIQQIDETQRALAALRVACQGHLEEGK